MIRPGQFGQVRAASLLRGGLILLCLVILVGSLVVALVGCMELARLEMATEKQEEKKNPLLEGLPSDVVAVEKKDEQRRGQVLWVLGISSSTLVLSLVALLLLFFMGKKSNPGPR